MVIYCERGAIDLHMVQLMPLPAKIYYYYYYNCYGSLDLSRTTQVSQYQKKHSPTHTYPDHQPSLFASSIYCNPWHPPKYLTSLKSRVVTRSHFTKVVQEKHMTCLFLFIFYTVHLFFTVIFFVGQRKHVYVHDALFSPLSMPALCAICSACTNLFLIYL